jgi:23S rRNA (cytidine1920-2'-O)/16S rRNA (cytidine1409-2'-O)-methyltransferase
MSMNSFHSRSARPAPKREAKEGAPRPRAGIRADQLLLDQGLAPSRGAARRLIASGRVTGPGGPVTKAAQEWPAGTLLRLAPVPGDPP